MGKQILRFWIQHKFSILFIVILLIGLFFRLYQPLVRYTYAHDADLFSWIVKDIAIDHHLRLIGQLTSADGIYIGPLFYYALIPFFFITHMDPSGGIILITILSMLNLISLYFVFSKLFNKTLGLIASFLWAVSLPIIVLDRWVVPSTPSNLWTTWYFYTVIMITRGNYSVLPLLAILIGLIWHIHIALAPPLLGIPIAMFVAKKWPTVKQMIIFFIILLISNSPLILFEVKHNFSQTHAFLTNLKINHGGGVGVSKFNHVVTEISSNVNALLLSPQSAHPFEIVLLVLILCLPALLIWKKILRLKDYLPLLGWIIGVFVFFSASSTLISEYYFFSLEILFIFFIGLLLLLVFNSGKKAQYLVLVLLGIFLIKNLYFFINTATYQKGYLARKSVAEYITEDSRAKGYPCVGINYITVLGENVGFRYFFYLDNLKVAPPRSGGPVYNIVLPAEWAKNELTYQYGEIGAIAPKQHFSQEQLSNACRGNNYNLTNSMLGFTK